MGIMIKMDNQTISGYVLRVIRTTKYQDAVDVYFVQYDHGEAKQTSEAVSTMVFRTICTIHDVGVSNNALPAKLNTTASPHAADGTTGIQGCSPVVFRS